MAAGSFTRRKTSAAWIFGWWKISAELLKATCMKPERWQQVETIFQAALKREPTSRAVFLDGACLDDGDLRAEVESLLAAHEQAGSFIQAPALEVAAQMAEPPSGVAVGR